jgi:hypothetical protein
MAGGGALGIGSLLLLLPRLPGRLLRWLSGLAPAVPAAGPRQQPAGTVLLLSPAAFTLGS